MQNIRLVLATFLFAAGLRASAQTPEVIQTYIATYKDIAIAEMQRTGVPASIKLAQGIHETMAGTSVLVTRSNNHFGIKCKTGWTGESVSHDDDARGECFRKYGSPFDSYRDHSNFLKNSPRYASLFAIDPMDYSSWAWGLKKAGYATNPRYPQIIIRLIEDYHLQDYTLIALGKLQPTDEAIAGNRVNDPSAATPEFAAGKIVESEPLPPVVRNYPAGEFRINDTKVIFAQKGESWLSIAQQHNISLSRLFEFNDLEETETLADDQLVFLQRKRKTGANAYHTVLNGETLYSIAQEEGIRMESLLEYNLLEENMQPEPGQQLCLKQKATARPLLVRTSTAKNDDLVATTAVSTIPVSSQSKATSRSYVTHTVQGKETVFSISRKYGVSIQDIMDWNNLNGYALKKGQQLKIYKPTTWQ